MVEPGSFLVCRLRLVAGSLRPAGATRLLIRTRTTSWSVGAFHRATARCLTPPTSLRSNPDRGGVL